MKRVMLGIIFVMAVVMILGLSWGKLFKREYTQDEYGLELAKRDQKIEQLEDSIRMIQAKLKLYEEAVKWFRNASEDELQRGIKEIRSVPKEVSLP
jgi:hypothetical protein